MAKKGLDTTFLHYGIRKEDITLIETLSINHQLDFDWVKEDLLKEFHERKIRNQECVDRLAGRWKFDQTRLEAG